MLGLVPYKLGVVRICVWLAFTPLVVSACGGSGGGGTPDGMPPPVGTGTVTLSWVAPLNNDNGTVLTNLSGFKIFYGNTPTSLLTEIDVADPGLEQFTVRNLAAGQYHFVIRSYNSDGIESLDSNIASITVN